MSLKRNIFANYFGQGWVGLMSLAFMPFYLKLMGVESSGIVGVFTSLMVMLTILDLGLSQSMNREMARLSIDGNNATRMVDTARTFEVIYWWIALGIVVTLVFLANFIAYHWLNPEHLTRESLMQALLIMALVIGLRWPMAIYLGGLNGLQRQVLVNTLLIIFTTLQGGGALAVLLLVEPTIKAFFLWQAVTALAYTVALRIALWRCFSSNSRGRFRKEVLRNTWRFAAGMTGISLVTTVLTQLDKVLLSRMLTLTEFGYYTFAATVAAVIYRAIAPVFTAYYPRLTELVSNGNETELIKTYHKSCQLMATVILPATLVLVFFSKEILEIWTNDPNVVAHSSFLISLLVIGNALNGFMHIPYALQLSYGWTKLTFYQNVVAAIILVPAIYLATVYWGAVGAAAVWILLNSGYLLISIQLMHRRLLVGEKRNWYVNDVGKPFLAVLVATGIVRIFVTDELGNMERIIALILTMGIATAAAIVSAETLRKRFIN